MSTARKPDLALGARYAEAAFDEATDRLVAMSDADFERAMDALPGPARVPSLEEFLVRAKNKASVHAHEPHDKVAPRPAPRRQRPRMLFAAAALGAVALTFAIEHHAITAWLAGPQALAPSIGPDPWRPPSQPALQAQAKALRDQATKACADEFWDLCKSRLDEGATLDPAGEASPQVQSLRATIVQNTAVRRGNPTSKIPGAH